MKSAFRYSDYITGQEEMLDCPNQLNLALATLLGESWEAMHLVLFDVDPRLKFDEYGTPSVRSADLPAICDAIDARITVSVPVCCN